MAQTGAIRNSFHCAKGDNPNYHVHISCPGMGLEIIADTPEEFSTAVGSEWESLMPGAIGDNIPLGGIFQNGVKFVGGTNAVLQYFSQQVWVNSSPIEIPLTLLFDAQDDSLKNVVAPIRALDMLAMPDVAAGILYSPGPNRGTIAGGARNVSLVIGQQLTLASVIVVSVTSTFSTRLDATGHPIAGRADVTFRTDRTLSRDEWKEATGVSFL